MEDTTPNSDFSKPQELNSATSDRESMAEKRIQKRRVALERLFDLAYGNSGGSRIAANFLLAWADSEKYGGFNPRDFFRLDPFYSEDVLTTFEMIARCSLSPESIGLEKNILQLAKMWRSKKRLK